MRCARLSLVLLGLATTCSAAGAELRLENGARLPGTLVRDEGERIVWRADLLGEIAVPRSAIAAESAALLVPVEPASSEWKRSGKIGVALDIDMRDSDSEELDVDARLAWQRDKRRHRIDASVDYEREEGQASEDEAELTYQADFLLERGWYVFGLLEYRRDREATVQEAIAVGPGVGREFHFGKRLDFALECAVTELDADVEQVGGYRDEAAILRWRGTWKLPWWRMELFHRGEHAWVVQQSELSHFEARTGLTVPVRDKLVGELRMDYEHYGTSPPGENDEDLEWVLSLAWRW
jgi:hypothetical protein